MCRATLSGPNHTSVTVPPPAPATGSATMGSMAIRTPDDLITTDEPAWPDITALAAEHDRATILPVDPEHGRRVLWRLQVTARSWLGGLALNCGGILADHGWFRLLGGGSEHLPDLAAMNGLADPVVPRPSPSLLVVGYDVLGGVFAIDGGGLEIAPGEVCYFAPDSLEWEGLGGGHGAFVGAVLSGGFGDAFDSLRWPGWEEEVAALRPDEGLSLVPPPFTAQGHDIASVSRRAVPIRELLGLYAGIEIPLT